MKQYLKSRVARVLARAAFEEKLGGLGYVPAELRGENVDAGFTEIARRIRPYTMTSEACQHALYQAVGYIEAARIPGALVECGVWRGGSVMLSCLALLQLGAERDVFLFDTYEGMTPATSADLHANGCSAISLLASEARRPDFRRWRYGRDSIWCIASLEEVRANLRSTGYPDARLHFVVGPVETTVPAEAPEQISLLRLDTDWYESTRHELVHLLPRVADGGVLLVDDYGLWQGQRKAVDETLREHEPAVLLNRIDQSGRIGVIRKGSR
jgi:O-methyltransferase